MANQGFLVDSAVMKKAENDFITHAQELKSLITKLTSEVTSMVGSTQNFNGAARMAFDRNHQALQERMHTAEAELNVISDRFRNVMTQHSAASDDHAQAMTRTASAMTNHSGSIFAGLNG